MLIIRSRLKPRRKTVSIGPRDRFGAPSTPFPDSRRTQRVDGKQLNDENFTRQWS
jgi:hypothetical protein